MSNPKLAGYELIRKIAAGGMAEIFLARQWGEAGFFRDVVIKRLFRHLAEHERQLRMFLDEARLLSQLAHPNIPQVYDVGTDVGFWYFAMEHVEGQTVADAWRMGAKAGQAMPLNVALGIMVQACEALHHAHERADRAGRALRIVHRDVTPHNIMLTRDGVVKLMDFGVASTSARKDTEAGAVRGTFAYMAPEQVRGKQLDKRADVFALGVVLYELTTGSRVFRGSDVQIMTQVVEEDVPPPSTKVPGYPADLEEIVVAALQRDRGNRIPSAAHLAAYLEEFAMRHGLMIGPRAVARYASAVTPAQPLLEESLAMVDVAPAPVHDPEARQVWQPEEEALPDIDESEVLDDLQLLSVPAGPPSSQESVPEPLRLPDDGEDDSEATNLDHLLDDPEGKESSELRFEESGSLVLDGFSEEGPKDQPVVLLDQASRKISKKKSKDNGDDTDYMAELERRFADDDDV
ncbi:MAG: serine/threonine protein kinase [Sandaracinaceae bacterium]